MELAKVRWLPRVAAISSVLFNLWFLVYFTSDLVEQSIVQAFNQMCVLDIT
ncbi:hypothetical protein Hanom_Chr12g01066631 [Helianthus anomalus]